MKDCNITSYLGDIQNDNFPIFGKIKFEATNLRSDNSKTFQVGCPANSGEKAIMLKGTFADGTTEKSFPTNGRLIDITTSNIGDIVLLPKYITDRIIAHADTGQKFKFNIEEFAYDEKMSYFTVNNTKAYGNIAALGNCPLLETVYVANTAVEGALEGFFENMVNAGSTMENFAIQSSSNNSFNSVVGARTLYAVFSTDTCQLYAERAHTTAVATYTKSSGWVYN